MFFKKHLYTIVIKDVATGSIIIQQLMMNNNKLVSLLIILQWMAKFQKKAPELLVLTRKWEIQLELFSTVVLLVIMYNKLVDDFHENIMLHFS
jgi:hypothetical protein